MNIPKSVFIKAIFSFANADRYEMVALMIPILEELRNYGHIAYFFSPFEFPLLVNIILNIELNITNFPLRISSELKAQLMQAQK